MSNAPLPARRPASRSPVAAEGGRLLRLLVLVLSVFASGCAMKSDIRELRNQVREMEEQQDRMLRMLVEMERAALDSLAVQSDVLFSLRGELNRQMLDVQEQLVTIQELTGQSQRSLAGIRDEIEARRSAIVRQEQRGGARDTARAAERGEPPPPGVESGGSPEELFNVAVRQFNRGSTTTARRAFERFVESYPNHRLAADAHFYLADVMVQENRLEEAIDAFLEIPELFPSASKVPDALYRAGLLHLELGNEDEARRLFQRVVNSYPDSGAAILAEEKLNEIEGR